MGYTFYILEGIMEGALEWAWDHLPLIGMLLFITFMNVNDSKKTKKFPPIQRPEPQEVPDAEDNDLGFEVPPLEGASHPEPSDGIYRERQSADSLAIEAEERADEQNRYMRYLKLQHDEEKRQREEENAMYREQAKLEEKQAKPLEIPPVTPQALATGIIYEEILGKPKALHGKSMVHYRK